MIFITGDLHGDYNRLLNERLLTKIVGEHLILLGDVGLIYASSNDSDGVCRENAILDYISTHITYTLLFIDGNHENHDRLNSEFEEVEYHGAKCHKIRNNIFHIMRGQVLELEEKTYFCMGGAYSIDAFISKDRLSKTKYEMPSEEEYSEAILNLEKHQWKIDYILSHAPCTKIQQFEFGSNLLEESLLNERLEYYREHIIGLKHYYCGHLHLDKDYIYNMSCLLYDVRMINTNETILTREDFLTEL